MTVILGDFNICYLKKPSNNISRTLENLQFRQLVNEPTHEDGGCIDHLYFYAPATIATDYLLEIVPAYYSDHDCLYLHLNVNQDRRKKVTVKTVTVKNNDYIKDIHRSTAKRKFSKEATEIPQKKKKR